MHQTSRIQSSAPRALKNPTGSPVLGLSELLQPAGLGGSGGRRRAFSAVPFDTYSMVVKLEAEGFTRGQAQCVTKTLQEVLRSSMEAETRLLVPKIEMEAQLTRLGGRVETVKLELQVRSACQTHLEQDVICHASRVSLLVVAAGGHYPARAGTRGAGGTAAGRDREGPRPHARGVPEGNSAPGRTPPHVSLPLLHPQLS
jgi:hypothetical protein